MISRVEHESFILGARNKTGQMAVLSDAMAFALGVMRSAPEPPTPDGLPFRTDLALGAYLLPRVITLKIFVV